MNASHPNINKLPPKGVIGAKNEKSNEVNFPRQRTKILKEKSTTPQTNSLKIKGFLAKGSCEKINSANP
tara:strand:- start:60 stop:266 length:207 start_codon:yes stop_codon:yes gene_type:complete